MSDEEKSTGEAAAGVAAVEEQVAEQPVADEHTTVPNPSQQQAPDEQTAPGKWEMPKPVFQQTSGYLPQGFVKDLEAGGALGAQEAAPSPDALPSRPPAKEPDLSAINLSAPTPAAVEPQPDLSDQLIPEEPEFNTAPEPPKNSGSMRAPMVVLGLLAILVFVAVFLTVVYFLFLQGPGDTNNF